MNAASSSDYPKPLPVLTTAIGFDMGLTYLVADSEGRAVKYPKYWMVGADALAKAQRRFAKAKKGSHR